MIRKSRPALRPLSAWLLFSLAFLAIGCGEEEVVDPYMYGSLDAVTRGWVSSENYLFEIDAPEFVFIEGNTGLVKSGTHLEIVVADDLENRAASWNGKLIDTYFFI